MEKYSEYACRNNQPVHHRHKCGLASYDSMDWNIRSSDFAKCLKLPVLWQPDSLQLWSRLIELSFISKNFKNRCILLGNIHGSKGDSCVPSLLTSYKKQSHLIVNLIVVWRLFRKQHGTLSFNKSSLLCSKPYSLVLHEYYEYYLIYIYIYIYIYITHTYSQFFGYIYNLFIFSAKFN